MYVIRYVLLVKYVSNMYLNVRNQLGKDMYVTKKYVLNHQNLDISP